MVRVSTTNQPTKIQDNENFPIQSEARQRSSKQNLQDHDSCFASETKSAKDGRSLFNYG